MITLKKGHLANSKLDQALQILLTRPKSGLVCPSFLSVSKKTGNR
jgi:hypothetical protein